jgi:hypothetical protein
MIQTAYSSGSGFNSPRCALAQSLPQKRFDLRTTLPLFVDNWFPPSDLKR